MARSRKCKVCTEWHDLDQPWPAECADHFPSRPAPADGLAAPMITFDTMDAIQSQTDGQMYDSKSALRAEYKKAGVIELGNERIKPKAPPSRKERRKEIRKRLEQASAKLGI